MTCLLPIIEFPNDTIIFLAGFVAVESVHNCQKFLHTKLLVGYILKDLICISNPQTLNNNMKSRNVQDKKKMTKQLLPLQVCVQNKYSLGETVVKMHQYH